MPKSTIVLSPLKALLHSRAVLVAALALALNVTAAIACPYGFEDVSCDRRVPVLLEAANTFGLVVIAKMAVEDGAQKLGLGGRVPMIFPPVPGGETPPALREPSAYQRKQERRH